MSRVTVLTAVFNGERYIRQALDSVLSQTLSDIQLICIDDASTDSTPSVLSGYAARDKRVSVITHNSNTGQAVARNDGLRVANGEYVTMLDADDWLSADALEQAVSVLDSDDSIGAVLLELRYVRDGVETPYNMRTARKEWSGEEAFALSLDWSIHGLYVARAGLYEKYPFDDTCRLYSDDNTTRMHYLHSEKVGSCCGVYFYRQHEGSMTGSEGLHRYDLLEANISMARQLRDEKVSRHSIALFERERWINLAGICIYWMDHERKTGNDDLNTSLKDRLRSAYNDIDCSVLPLSLRLKPGYCPCRNFDRYLKNVAVYRFFRKMIGR